MSDDTPIPDPPKTPGEHITFIGKATGKPVVVVKRPEENVFEVQLPDNPAYKALLVRSGRDSFDLEPAPGVPAVGGMNMTWADLVDNF